MDDFQLNCFITVSKFKSFTRAADELFVSQSTISKRIAMLEKELDIILLERNKRHVKLTPAGQFFYEHASCLLGQFEDVINKTRQIANGKSGEITIGIYDNLDFNRIVPGFLREFFVNNADMKIRLYAYGHRRLYDMLCNGEVDLAFLPATGDDLIGKFNNIPINRGNIRLYFSNKHRLAGRPNLTLEDFEEEVFITVKSTQSNIFGNLDEVQKNYKSHFRQVVEVETIRTLELYLEANMGVSILGSSQTFLNSNYISNIRLDDFSDAVGTDAVWLKENDNPALPVLIAAIKKYLKLMK